MRKFGVFSVFLFLAILIAGLYGAIHDQITYTISPEYFTKFKYRQFGFDPSLFGGHRPTVAIIGFLATWWTGMFIGVFLGLTALIFPNHRTMAAALRRAILIVIASSVAFAVFGGVYGRLHLAATGVDWWMPKNLKDQTAFITVGSIHNFSYLGGLCGMIGGIMYLLRRWQLNKRQNQLVETSS